MKTALPLVAAAFLSVQPACLLAEQTVLVLDGSGSMWGQIDGEAKIGIARDVIGALLDDLSQDRALGLTAYGHRREGDCNDIETLVTPGPDTRAAIAAAVATITPRGKTPMSAAVTEAARALRHTDEKATVILISDGLETCEADPCAVAAELEASGVDFTAHVVGFDISDPLALEQLQCIASKTGGTYQSARDADELGQALRDVAVTPQEPPSAPEPQAPPVVLNAPDKVPAGTIIDVGVTGDIRDTDFVAIVPAGAEAATAEIYVTMALGSPARIQTPTAPGEYRLVYLQNGQDGRVLAETTLTLTEAGPALNAPDSAAAGSQIEVSWSGPGTEWDFLTIARPDAGGGYETASDYLATGGNPIAITMPSAPGTYELRYIYGENREILVKRTISAN